MHESVFYAQILYVTIYYITNGTLKDTTLNVMIVLQRVKCGVLIIDYCLVRDNCACTCPLNRIMLFHWFWF
jgi:hypothetical protein